MPLIEPRGLHEFNRDQLYQGTGVQTRRHTQALKYTVSSLEEQLSLQLYSVLQQEAVEIAPTCVMASSESQW